MKTIYIHLLKNQINGLNGFALNTSPAHRPKMSDVDRMLEGEGLAEKWAASHNYTNQSTNQLLQ
ncbi:unnamed protein product [Coffea canephora]|uniref:Uncharacterized protein n=1 Tax=Coffea canephora TaxID=49390 RepID=A0A068U0V6_COFCA|nr:unnamed protein product [Coffea canephora]